MKKTSTSFVMLFSCLVILATILFSGNSLYASPVERTVPGRAYSYGNRGDYKLSDEKAIAIDERIASITVTGDINKTTDHNGISAYGVQSGNVSITMNYNGRWIDESGKKYLLSDSGKKVDEFKLDSKIGKGVFLFYKSYDGENWELATNPIVNVFEDNQNGLKSFYTTSGEDLKRGCYYRIILAYKCRLKEDASFDFWFIHQNYEDKSDSKYLELYEFFLCNNAGNLSLHNLSVDSKDITDVAEGVTSEVLLKGETLLDGSATKAGFSIDTLGVTYKSIKVNGRMASDGDKFTTPGKYVIEATTKLDDTSSRTVYIYNGGEDKGYKDYFGDGLVVGNRVFREGDYPTYSKGTVAQTIEISADIPSLTGTIKNLSSGKEFSINGDRRFHSYKLEEGEYCADLYSGNPEAGSLIHYVFHFSVLNEDSRPYVNYNELMTSTRICDLSSAHYEVVYQTTRGGYIFVCFESQEEAFKYAYDIEKRFIEKNGDGEIYYKSLDNQNEKVKYPIETDKDKMALTAAINYYAAKNVEKAYFDATTTFTYQTFENGDDLLASLESLSIAESVKVFPSEEEREKLIKRAPYLNGYTFIKVDDYDVTDVTAVCEKDGKSYPIRFGRPINQQLNVSSKYEITEKNKYGDSYSYDTFYMAQNETISSWTIWENGKSRELSLSADVIGDSDYSISCDAIALESISNEFDEFAIISVSSKDAYKYELSCLIDEAKGLVLYKKGVYVIKFIDRTGNSYKFFVEISGKKNRDAFAKGKYFSYVEVYNKVHVNKKSEND